LACWRQLNKAGYPVTFSLGKRKLETFTGLYNALCDYSHPLLDSYNPDIRIDEVMNKRQLAYFHLNCNQYSLLGPAIGKVVLRHINSMGGMRQAYRDSFDQMGFPVTVDEAHQFLFESLLVGLATLRDAHIQFRLAHQSLADLESISPSFEKRLRTNTRWKILFHSTDPDHLEMVSRSYGTHTTFKRTVRYSMGPLGTLLNSGETSNREVQEFRVHPDSLKALKSCGQGFLLLPDRMEPVSFAMLPEFGGGQGELEKNDEGEGLGLYRKFVRV